MSLATSVLKQLKKPGNLINVGFGGWAAADTYKTKRQEGHGAITSAAAAAFDATLPLMMGAPAYMGLQLVTGAPEAAMSGYTSYHQYKRQLAAESRNQAFMNAKFDDTEQAHTMRQAGMAIAQRSKYNMQHAMLGNEAKYMMK